MRRCAIFLVIFLASCNRAPAPPTTSAASPTNTVVEMHSITQLPPNRTVHIAVDTLGNIFYTVETDDGHDGVVVVGDAGIPRATQLTSDNILAAMGETVGGNGAIESIVPGTNGSIFFYFIGGKGKILRACVGQYQPRGELIQILFDTQKLTDQSGMGESIALARGTLLPAGGQIDLFLRHTDAAVILSFDARGPNAPSLTLSRILPAIQAEEQTIDLTRDQYDLFAGFGAELLLLDRSSGQLFTIDVAGTATPRMSLAGLPRDISTPLMSGRDRIVIVASDSQPIETDTSDMRRLPKIAFPALLQITGDQIDAIGRDDLHVFGGFPTYAMRLHEMVLSPDGSFIAYDLSSGLLMRLRITSE